MRTTERAHAKSRWCWAPALSLTLALTASVSAPACAQPAASRAAPAMFRGGPEHPGVYAGEPLLGIGGLAWRVQTQGTIRSTPTVHGESVYVGSGDGHLYAIDRESGAVRWTFDAGSAVTSSPAANGGLVFFGTYHDDFFAVRAADGELAWQVQTGPALPFPWGHESGDTYTSSPTVAGDLVLFGSGDGHVYCVDAESGAGRWTFGTGGRVRSSPAVAAGTVYVGSADGSVYAIDLDSGEQRWRYDTLGRDLFSGDFGYDRRTVQSSPAVADGVVYVGARDGFLYAIDAATGELRWSFDQEISWVNTSPAVVDGTVYAGSSDGRFVQAVDAASGEELWRLETPSAVWSSPAVVGGMVYFGDFSGRIHAIDRASGEERWSYRVGSSILSSPVPKDGILYFGSDDGGIYALRGSEGPPLRRAVFWDSTYVRAIRFGEHEAVRDFLSARGYEVLDAPALKAFLDARVVDRAPSVVVFAMDRVPESVAPVAADTVLFRRYLDAGGKVVWLGIPPLLWRLAPDYQSVDIRAIDWAGVEALLGVDHRPAIFDAYSARPTDAGIEWGLSGWWRGRYAADPGSVTAVLGLDERGFAAAWYQSYGGPPGTGFVRVPGEQFAGRGARSSDLVAIQTAAEYMPRRR